MTFGEFPVFFPYPKTELGEYSIEHGYFDGDFDKLHMNYQTDSPLNCFSEKEKLMQVNLSLLATVCLLFPSMRNITVKLAYKTAADEALLCNVLFHEGISYKDEDIPDEVLYI